MLDVTPDLRMTYDKTARVELMARAEAACNTALLLMEHGLELDPEAGAKDEAAKLAAEYAENPASTTTAVNDPHMNALRPASLIFVDQILNEFGRNVADNVVAIRNVITNKLLTETENPDARVRLRALELLGKISDVGLFTEKSEVTIHNKSSDDIRNRLRSKLSKMSGSTFTAEDAVTIESEEVTVNKAFGLTHGE